MPDRSDHKAVQVILHKIHRRGINYIASVSKSFNTAESGYAFAKLAQKLCITLSNGRDKCSKELIYASITKMQEIARKAHDDARVTTPRFDDNRREFTKVRRNHTDESVIRQNM
jgi:hypothetical protein